jgi:hypothetical protein
MALIVRILLPNEKAFDGSARRSRFNCCSDSSVKVVLVVQVRGASVDQITQNAQSATQ